MRSKFRDLDVGDKFKPARCDKGSLSTRVYVKIEPVLDHRGRIRFNAELDNSSIHRHNFGHSSLVEVVEENDISK